MIRRSLLIAIAAVGVMVCSITPMLYAQSNTTAAPNAPISVTPPPPETPKDQNAKPAEKPAPVMPKLPDPVPQQEQLPLGVAQPDLPPATHVTSKKVDTTSPSDHWMLQTIMALALVIALIFAVRLALRRLTGWAPARVTGRADALVEVLSRSTIGPKTSVVFLKINQRVVVAGQTPAGMNTLTEFDDPDQVAAILTQVEANRPHSISRSFGSLLRQVDRSYQSTDTTATGGGDEQEHIVDRTRDSMSGLLGRIRALKKRDGGDA